MPRYLYRRTEAQRSEQREKRTRRENWRPMRSHPQFIDYYRLAGASQPEMMVYAELVRRNVPFAFAKYFGDIPFTQEVERFRPDFTLEEYKIIIRVQGSYWHTREGAAEDDARQSALLTMLGWKVYDLWEFDIIKDVKGAVDEIPELVTPAILGTPEPTLGRPHNVMASFISRLQKPPKVQRTTYKAKAQAKPLRQYKTLRKHAPYTMDYLPIRFLGWEEEPEKWPGADNWWKEREKQQAQEWQSLSDEFQQFEQLTGVEG